MGTLDKVCSMWSFQTGGKSKTTEKVVREDMQRVCVKTEDARDRVGDTIRCGDPKRKQPKEEDLLICL